MPYYTLMHQARKQRATAPKGYPLIAEGGGSGAVPMPAAFVYGPQVWQKFCHTLARNTPLHTKLECYPHGTEVGFTLHGLAGWTADFHVLQGRAHLADVKTPPAVSGQGHGISAFLAVSLACATLPRVDSVTFSADWDGTHVWAFWGAPLDQRVEDYPAHARLLPHLKGYAARSALVPAEVKLAINARVAAKDRHILPWLIHESGLDQVPFGARNLASDMIDTAPNGGRWDGRVLFTPAQEDLHYMLGIYRRVSTAKGWAMPVQDKPTAPAAG